LYNTLRDSSINFEIVFVGPNEPDFILPSNFKYIKSNVKPAQCVEIASRNTSGELIMQIADDVEFRVSDPLSRLYSVYMSCGDEKLILSCRYMRNGKRISVKCHRFHSTDPSTPMISVAGLMSNKLYKTVGGIDRNFIAVCGDVDVIMRIHGREGKVALSDVYVNENSITKGLYSRYKAYDRRLLDSLWSVDGTGRFNRTRPFEPFSNERILEESQGPKGEWD
jgi:hypothetical protein